MNVMVQKLIYTGKKRTINLSFDVFASSEEAEANPRRINELALYATPRSIQVTHLMALPTKVAKALQIVLIRKLTRTKLLVRRM